MKLVVCVKQIEHVYARTGTNPESCFLAEEDCLPVINPYDEAAFELALSIKQLQENAEIVLVTLGPMIAEKQLRRLIALGGDQVIRIETPEKARQLNPQQKAALLAKAIGTLQPDLVLCGKESLDRKNGQVPALLAHRLRIPFVSGIHRCLINHQDRAATVERRAGKGVEEIWTCDLPALFSAELSRGAPAMAPLKDRVCARHFPIQTICLGEANNGFQPQSPRLFPPFPRTKARPAPDSTLPSFIRIQQLLSGSPVKKHGELVYGPPEVQVQRIITFLKEQKII